MAVKSEVVQVELNSASNNKSTSKDLHTTETDSILDSDCSDNSATSESTVTEELDMVVDQQDDLRKPATSVEATFNSLRRNYLTVILCIMLADGLQGTHLYVLYEGYGFSVASLYALGFITGAITTPLTGSLVDKFGRKASAICYCLLEITINQLEQYPFLAGLIVSRMVGGITTNLLSTVFEAWLDTEYRKRGLPEEKYEIIMRDAVIVTNLASIVSGYLAHVLAERYGPVGPFKGAVSSTTFALGVVAFMWKENYGKQETNQTNDTASSSSSNESPAEEKSIAEYVRETINVFRNDSKVLRVGIIQGFTVGCLQIFIFLWSPTLAEFAKVSNAPFGLDSAGEPAYGLIFGAYMAAGVLGGLSSPYVRKAVSWLLTPLSPRAAAQQQEKVITEEGEEVEVRPMAVEFMASVGYIICAALLFVPVLMDAQNERSFAISLAAFLVYEFLVGVIMPCEGIIRSLYLPSDCRASIMTLPRMIVNIQVSLGVILTNRVTHQSAFTVIAFLMVAAAGLQITLISKREWESLFVRAQQGRQKSIQMLRRTSSCFSSIGSMTSALDSNNNSTNEERDCTEDKAKTE